MPYFYRGEPLILVAVHNFADIKKRPVRNCQVLVFVVKQSAAPDARRSVGQHYVAQACFVHSRRHSFRQGIECLSKPSIAAIPMASIASLALPPICGVTRKFGRSSKLMS